MCAPVLKCPHRGQGPLDPRPRYRLALPRSSYQRTLPTSNYFRRPCVKLLIRLSVRLRRQTTVLTEQTFFSSTGVVNCCKRSATLVICCSQWSSDMLTTPKSNRRRVSFFTQCDVLVLGLFAMLCVGLLRHSFQQSAISVINNFSCCCVLKVSKFRRKKNNLLGTIRGVLKTKKTMCHT